MPQTALQRFGSRVKELRRRRSETQEQLAHRVGVHPNYVSQIETGRTNPPLSTVLDLARALRVQAAELLYGVDAPVPREARRLDLVLAGRSREEQDRILRGVALIVGEK